MQDNPFPFFETALSVVAAVALAMFLSPIAMFNTFVVAGHAHFIAAWYYQWRAGKMTALFLVALFSLALGTITFTATATLDWQVAVAGTLFIAHNMFDELRLLGVSMLPRRLFELAVPGFLYEAVFLTSIFGQNTVAKVSVAFAGVAACTVLFYGVRAYVQRVHVSDYFTHYLALLSVPLTYLLFHQGAINPEALIGTLILYHYIKWYLYSYRRIPTRTARRVYVRHMIIINVVVGSIFITSFLSSSTLFSLWFTPQVFYFATIMHILSSFLQFGFQARPMYITARS